MRSLCSTSSSKRTHSVLALLFPLGLAFACADKGSGLGTPGLEVAGGAGGLGGALTVPSAAGVGGGGSPGAGAGGQSGASGAAGTAGQGGAALTLRSYLGDSAYPDDFWTQANPSEASLDLAPLEQARQRITDRGWELHSFLVARNGKLVFEQYGWKSGKNVDDPDKTPHQVVPSERHLVHSTTKSVTSALIGIAIAEGALPGVTDPVVPHFADYQPLPNPDPQKDAMTLADLLSMRSGLEWKEGVDDQAVFFDAPDPALVMLSRPVVDKPVGTVWKYNSGACDVITALLNRATGKSPLVYAKEKLFGPLGIVDPPWNAAKNGVHHGGWGLELTTREMARFGELYRNRGVWGGKQVVPASWTDESTTSKCTTPWSGDYGYLWWLPAGLPGFFGTRGAYGQDIFINRALGLVVAFTSDLPVDYADGILESIVKDYVLPAVK